MAKAQHNLVDAVMPGKKIAKSADVTQKIGKDFNTGEKGGMKTAPFKKGKKK